MRAKSSREYPVDGQITRRRADGRPLPPERCRFEHPIPDDTRSDPIGDTWWFLCPTCQEQGRPDPFMRLTSTLGSVTWDI